MPRVGEQDPSLDKKRLFGGDLGDSILTDGMSCGDGCICIDTGRLCGGPTLDTETVVV